MYFRDHKASRLLKKPEAVVIDLDDVILIGTEKAWQESANASFGVEFMESFFAEVKKWGAVGGISLVNYIGLKSKENPSIENQLKENYKDFQRLFAEKRNDHLKLSENFSEFIQVLKKDGVRVILHSARSRETVIPDLKKFNIENCFDSIYCK